ncbi:MAG: MFS transporter [Chloroflexi bacterium]|nr:MFS transporter [Chloroflexota bacterium]
MARRRGREEFVPSPDDPPLPKGLKGTLIAFEVPNFRLLFAGRATSNLARQMRVFLRAWMVLELTDSPFLMGVVASSLSWPMLVLPFVGGVLADRVDRKKLLQWTESLLTILWAATALTVFMGAWEFGPTLLRVQWWHFIITSFISGVVQSIGRPGHQAMIGSIMDRRRMPSAVALDSISDTWPRAAGPAVAALAIWLVGGDWHTWGPWLFGLTSAGQFLTFLTIMLMRWQPTMNVSRGRERRGSGWTDFIEGLKLIKSHSVLLSLVSMSFAFTLFAGGAGFLLPVFARDVFGLGSEAGAAAFGVLSTAQTVGSSIGAAINVALANFGSRGKLLLTVGFLHGISVVIFSQSVILGLSVVLIVTNSMTGVFFRTSQRMILQHLAPNEMRGRVMAMDVFQQGLSPFGVLVWGTIAQLMQNQYGLARGTQNTWLLGGVMYVLVIMAFFVFVPTLRRFSMDQVAPGRVASSSPGTGASP